MTTKRRRDLTPNGLPCTPKSRVRPNGSLILNRVYFKGRRIPSSVWELVLNAGYDERQQREEKPHGSSYLQART